MHLTGAILLMAFAACAADESAVVPDITFIHLNDTYRIDAVEDGHRGGFSRIASIVRKAGVEVEGADPTLLTTEAEWQVALLLSQLPAKVAEVRDDSVMLDLNHELAGKALTFEVSLVEIVA